jgi:hypothetical protein
VGYVTRIVEIRNAHKIIRWNTCTEYTTPERYKHRCEDNIKKDFRRTWMDWLQLTQGRYKWQVP